MGRVQKTINALLLAMMTAALLAPPRVQAQDCTTRAHREPGLMAVDLAAARPVGIVATVSGFVLFVVSSPFSAMGGNSREAWDSLVGAPADYTFKRPLGHFDCEPSPTQYPK